MDFTLSPAPLSFYNPGIPVSLQQGFIILSAYPAEHPVAPRLKSSLSLNHFPTENRLCQQSRLKGDRPI